jgi:hypothetical protein
MTTSFVKYFYRLLKTDAPVASMAFISYHYKLISAQDSIFSPYTFPAPIVPTIDYNLSPKMAPADNEGCSGAGNPLVRFSELSSRDKSTQQEIQRAQSQENAFATTARVAQQAKTDKQPSWKYMAGEETVVFIDAFP